MTGRRIVVEAKDVKRLTKRHIDETIKKYRYPRFPDEYHLAVSKRTEVPAEVRRHSRKKNVKIVRLRY